MTAKPLTPEARALFAVPNGLAGVLVLAIADDSPFAELDIAPGDVLVSIDRRPVATPRQVVEALKGLAGRDGGAVLIRLNRSGVSHFIALPLGAAGG